MAPTVFFTIEKTTTAFVHESVDVDDLWDHSLSELFEADAAEWEIVEEDVVVSEAEAVPD